MGARAAQLAEQTARKTFEEGIAADTLPSITIAKANIVQGVGLLTLIVEAGFAGSNGEARRHIKGGAIKINDVAINDERAKLDESHLNDDGVIKLSMVKRSTFWFGQNE